MVENIAIERRITHKKGQPAGWPKVNREMGITVSTEHQSLKTMTSQEHLNETIDAKSGISAYRASYFSTFDETVLDPENHGFMTAKQEIECFSR